MATADGCLDTGWMLPPFQSAEGSEAHGSQPGAEARMLGKLAESLYPINSRASTLVRVDAFTPQITQGESTTIGPVLPDSHRLYATLRRIVWRAAGKGDPQQSEQQPRALHPEFLHMTERVNGHNVAPSEQVHSNQQSGSCAPASLEGSKAKDHGYLLKVPILMKSKPRLNKNVLHLGLL